MRKSLLAVVVGLVAALSLSLLVGCSGVVGAVVNSKKGDDYTKNFTGTWEAVSVSDGSTTYGEDTLSTMKSMGMTVVLTMESDGDFTLEYFDESRSGSWKAKDATTAQLTMGGETVDATLSAERLTISADGNDIVFAKEGTLGSTSGSTPSSSAVEAAKATAKAKGTVIADDNLCTIVAMPANTSSTGPGYVMALFNNSDQPLYFTTDKSSFSVNGKSTSNVLLSLSLKPGEYDDDDYFWFDDYKSASELVNVTGTIEVWNDSTNKTLRTYDFKM